VRYKLGVARGVRALLVIDIQRDYFPGGAYPLVGPAAAAEAAARVLGAFRASGEPVIHLQHVWDAPEATFMRPGTEGVEIHPDVLPEQGELVIQKAEPNAFLATGLEEHLRSQGTDELVVVGMMTSMCVDATVRAGSDLGFEVTLVHDACAAPDLSFGETDVAGAQVHAAFIAALGDGYAKVIGAGDIDAA
jgi:nicotinamidase-related amidase